MGSPYLTAASNEMGERRNVLNVKVMNNQMESFVVFAISNRDFKKTAGSQLVLESEQEELI